MSSSLIQLVPAAWCDVLPAARQALAPIDALLLDEAGEVFPPRDRVFAALEHTPPGDVRVVLLGQDPYPTAGNANGLAFSVAPGMKIPASLRNLFKGLALDLGVTVPTSGDLGPWAQSGVLLLNAVLTVRKGEPGSHKRRGWETFTRTVLGVVAARAERVVFLALGKPAQALLAPLVEGTPHVLLALPHPSPLNGNAFVDAAARERPFSRINALLVEAGRAPADWAL